MFLGTKGEGFSYACCLGEVCKVLFEDGPMVNDDRINLEKKATARGIANKCE